MSITAREVAEPSLKSAKSGSGIAGGGPAKGQITSLWRGVRCWRTTPWWLRARKRHRHNDVGQKSMQTEGPGMSAGPSRTARAATGRQAPWKFLKPNFERMPAPPQLGGQTHE